MVAPDRTIARFEVPLAWPPVDSMALKGNLRRRKVSGLERIEACRIVEGNFYAQ